MTVFGYTLAILGVLFGGCLSAWAILMGFQSLFPRRAEMAQRTIECHPWRSTLIGLAVWLTLGLIGLVLIQAPAPAMKLVGTIWISALAAFTTVGVSGLSQIVSQQLKQKDSTMSQYGSESRAALIIVSSVLLPFVGWFAVLPLLLSMGLGAGMRAAFARRTTQQKTGSSAEAGL